MHKPVHKTKLLQMVAPDFLLIGCAICGSHDVGASSTKAHCYGCKASVIGINSKDTIHKWNNRQLELISGN